MGVKRQIALVPLVAVLIAVVLFGVVESAASIADTNVPGSVTTGTPSHANEPTYSANATITIIMRTPPLLEE
jgi:hypothetical protein